MNTLEFKLISNEEVLINEKTNYFIKDNILNFKIEDDTYKLDMDNNILKKSNKESIITMDFDNYIIIIELVSNHASVSMDITKKQVEINENKINIKYEYEGEVLTHNEIIINY